MGGPPCQDFSSAGKRSEGSRAQLTEVFAQIVTAARPQWFVMENVARARDSAAISRAIQVLTAAGYLVSTTVLDAADYGVPQRRNRLVVFGARAESKSAQVFAFQMGLTDLMRPRTTVRQVLEPAFDHYYRHPRSYTRRAVFSVDELSPTVRGVNRPMPPNYQAHPNDSAPPLGVHELTTSERALIQTFPASFEFSVPKTHAEQMIGNAVPPPLAAAVASAVKGARECL